MRIDANFAKIGDEFESLAEVEGIFAAHPDVHRIQVARHAPQRYVITLMDDQRPNDLKKISELGQVDYEHNSKRGWERVSNYHLPTDTVRFVFYRLQE